MRLRVSEERPPQTIAPSLPFPMGRASFHSLAGALNPIVRRVDLLFEPPASDGVHTPSLTITLLMDNSKCRKRITERMTVPIIGDFHIDMEF